MAWPLLQVSTWSFRTSSAFESTPCFFLCIYLLCNILYSDTYLVTFLFGHMYVIYDSFDNESVHCLVVGSEITHCSYLFHFFHAGTFVILPLEGWNLIILSYILLSHPWWGEALLIRYLLCVLPLEGRNLVPYWLLLSLLFLIAGLSSRVCLYFVLGASCLPTQGL